VAYPMSTTVRQRWSSSAAALAKARGELDRGPVKVDVRPRPGGVEDDHQIGLETT